MIQRVGELHRIGLAALLCASAITVSAAAQPPMVPEAERPGTILAWMEGEWAGSGWAMDPSGQRRTFDIFETATIAAGRHAVMIRGEGFGPEGSGRAGMPVHDAAGLISRAGEGYQMRSVVMQGYMQDAPMTLREDGFDWAIEMGPRGRVRYSATYADGVWTETGQWCAPNSNECRDTFYMRLERLERVE